MLTNVKLPDNVIRVSNQSSTLTIKIDKKQLLNTIRKIAIIVLFTVLGISLFITYTTGSYNFWPLLSSSAILGLVAFIAFKSGNDFKKS